MFKNRNAPGEYPPCFNTSTLLRGVPPQFPLPTGNRAVEAADEAFTAVFAAQNRLGVIKNAALAG